VEPCWWDNDAMEDNKETFKRCAVNWRSVGDTKLVELLKSTWLRSILSCRLHRSFLCPEISPLATAFYLHADRWKYLTSVFLASWLMLITTEVLGRKPCLWGQYLSCRLCLSFKSSETVAFQSSRNWARLRMILVFLTWITLKMEYSSTFVCMTKDCNDYIPVCIFLLFVPMLECIGLKIKSKRKCKLKPNEHQKNISCRVEWSTTVGYAAVCDLY